MKKILFILVLAGLFVSCARKQADIPEQEKIIPTPKKVHYTEHLLPVWSPDIDSALCEIAIAAEALQPVQLGVQVFQDMVAAQVGKGMALPQVTPEQPQQAPLRIILNCADQNTGKSKALKHGEGYTIQFHKKGGKQQVQVVGSDPRGAYYGAQSLAQLLVKRADGLYLRRAEIHDWPTYRIRAFKSQAFEGEMWAMRDSQRMLRWAPQFKFNFFSPCYTHLGDFKNPDQRYTEFMWDICNYAKNTGLLGIIQEVNVYYGNTIVISDPMEVGAVAELFRYQLDSGFPHIMLQYDDFAKLHEKDKETFPTLAAANVHLTNEIYKISSQEYPNLDLWVCPPVYFVPRNDEEEAYLPEFAAGIHPQVKIIWTGYQVTTTNHTEENLEEFFNWINHRPVVYWDNTLKMPPGWSNTFRCNPFLTDCEDIDSSAWRKLHEYINGRFVGNTYGPSETYKIPLATMADFLWNPKDYQPESSFTRACYRFDPANPNLGERVAHFCNETHQKVYDLRVALCKDPSRSEFNQFAQAVDELERELEELRHMTDNKILLAQVEPYVTRHRLVIPYLQRLVEAKDAGETEFKRRLVKETIPGLEAVREKVIKKKGIGEEQEGVFRGGRLEKKNINDLRKLLENDSL